MASSVRLLVQQCVSAQLSLPNQDVLRIGNGMVLYVCFAKTAEEENVVKAAELLLKLKLSEAEEDSRRKNILDVGGDVLIVPQATLGGKLKGSSVQYHGNIQPDQGKILYEKFCSTLENIPGLSVRRGEYGARQVLSMVTNGPYSHCLDV